MDFNPENIRKALARDLHGTESHRKMAPPGRELTAKDSTRAKLRRSSVLMLLFKKEDRLLVCLIKRPAHMKHHGGQVALPGGQVEQGETALETALRETWEEIGVPPQKVEILGTLSELYVGVSGFLVRPFVGWLKENPSFSLNPGEVEKTILYPLMNYKNSFDQAEMNTPSGKIQVPCIRYNGEIIWGATAMILSEFYDIMEEHFMNKN